MVFDVLPGQREKLIVVLPFVCPQGQFTIRAISALLSRR
jgi:hypothetical protein